MDLNVTRSRRWRRHRRASPSVDVVATESHASRECTEAVSRRRRSAQGAENPYEKGTSMGLFRAESIRTCRELGYVTDGDRVVSVDRALGKAHDAFAVAQTLKIYTVSAEGGEI